MFCKSPEVTLCGWRGYQPSMNNGCACVCVQEVKFRPLGGFALLQAQSEGRKKQRLRTMIRQTAAFLLLTTTLLAVAHLHFGPTLLRAAGHVENTFVFTDTAASGTVDFYNISR